MGYFRLKNNSGTIEKVDSVQYVDLPASFDINTNASLKETYFSGTLTMVETAASVFGVPIGQFTHVYTSRTVTDGVTTSGSRTVTTSTGSFTSADLGKTLVTTDFSGTPTIVTVNSSTSADLSTTATSGHTGQTFVIGAKRILTNYADTSAGNYVQTVSGNFTVRKEHTGQTGDLLTLQNAIGTRLFGVTTAGVPQVAAGYVPSADTDLVSKVYADYPRRCAQVTLFTGGSDVTSGDFAGGLELRIPAEMNAYNLSAVAAHNTTASTSGAPTVAIRRGRQPDATTAPSFVDMLTTNITIDANEYDSRHAAVAAVISGGADDVLTGDVLRFDVDEAGTGTKGLVVDLTFTKP